MFHRISRRQKLHPVALPALCALALSLARPAAAQVYSNDFQTSVGSERSAGSITPTLANPSRKFLGIFDNHDVTLHLSGLAPHTSVTLAFDLYLLNSWDGNHAPGPDYWSLSADGAGTLLNTTFSNVWFYGQAYSAANPNGSFAAGTSADEQGTLGFDFYGNSVYKFGGPINPSFTFAHTGSDLTLHFAGSNLQGYWDEGWGLDNVQVSLNGTTPSAVPEPASMTLLGLGALGMLRRRRAARTAVEPTEA